jgi:hypothetical protein
MDTHSNTTVTTQKYSFTKLTLDFKSTWLPIVIITLVILATMVIVSLFTNGTEIHTHNLRENDRNQINQNRQLIEAAAAATVNSNEKLTEVVTYNEADLRTSLSGRGLHMTYTVQICATFFSIAVCLVCVSFEVSKTLDLWLLTLPWSIWMLFSSFTVTGGLDVSETVSLIASCVSVTMILFTYSHYIRCRRGAVLLVLLVCIAAILFFPHTGANAFTISTQAMIPHVITYCAAYVIIGYFDALMGEKLYMTEGIGNQAVRVLRVSWVLFVENRLLFFLVPQVFITILHLNHVLTMNFVTSKISLADLIIGATEQDTEQEQCQIRQLTDQKVSNPNYIVGFKQ